MNIERCVALHNEILKYGWLNSGRSAADFDSKCNTWFDTYAESSEHFEPEHFQNALTHLSPDLIRFFKQAWDFWEPGFQFFYWVRGLSSPDFMVQMSEHFKYRGIMNESIRDEVPWNNRYVLLYPMSNFTGHFMGLIFDQKTHLGIICPTIYNAHNLFDEDITWYPLETILEFWLGQLAKGRIDAVPGDGGKYNTGPDYDFMSRHEPWVFVPYNETMLQENLDTWNQLVEAIETRMPDPPSTDSIEFGLVDKTVLDSMSITNSFLSGFLLLARRPRFATIAPGLSVPESDTITKQPFTAVDGEQPPILVFRAEQYSIPSLSTDVPAERQASAAIKNCSFVWPGWKRFPVHPAGLYMLPTDLVQSEDECSLILPYAIGANGWAVSSDGHRWRKESHADLYKLGHSPFETKYNPSLVDVLKSWLGMVEREDWEIDENGVAGGIEIWKEADTEEGWQGYVIPLVKC